MYKKLEQAQGLEGQLLDVMIYFWDDPSDSAFCGWWFGPKVGGDQVWAFHPTQTAATPPTTGWKVPVDSDVDATMVLAPGHAKLPPKPPAPPPKPAADEGPPPGIWQQPASNGAPQEAKKPVVPRVSKEEDEKRKAEQSAVLAIKRVVQRVKLAKPDTFEALEQELGKVLEEKRAAAGSQATKVCEEAAKALEQAKKRVGLATVHLQKVGEQREEVAKDREVRREAVKGLLQQLESHVVKLEKETESLRKVGIELQSDDREVDAKASEEAVRRIAEQSDVCKAEYEACAEFNTTNFEKASGLLTESRQEAAALMQRAETAARSREPLRQAAERSRTQALERRESVRLAAARKAVAEEWIEQQRRLFQSYDHDRDGALNRREVVALAKAEFGVEMQQEALDQIFLEPIPLPITGTPDPSDEPAAGAAGSADQSVALASAAPARLPMLRGPRSGVETGVRFADFQQLKVSIGILREVARDDVRKVENQERRRVLALAREGRRAALQEVAEAIGAAMDEALQAEEKARALIDFGDSLAAMESADCARAARAAEETLEAARSSQQSVQQRVADASADASIDEELRPDLDRLRDSMNRLHSKIVRATQRNSVFWRRMDELRRVEDEAMHNRIMSLLRSQLESGDNRRQRSEILFAKIDSKCDGKVDQEELVSFLKANWDADSFPQDGVIRWFQQLEGDDTTSINADCLHRLVRTCYKVLQASIMTDRLNVSDDEVVIKKLAVDDVLEMYDEPKEDKEKDILRLRARSLPDGAVGYVTIKGNNGTVYLDAGGNHFAVVKDTLLTASFAFKGEDANGGSDVADQATSDDKVFPLKEGEILEVFEYAKKDEASGSMRMRVKVLSNGAVGWATAIGAQGTVFLKPI